MEFIDEGIEEYARLHTEPENDLLKELVRETHAMVLQPRMLSGHLQGRFLSFIAKVYQPSLILEIGTYTGYSSLCMALALPEVRITALDKNPEWTKIANKYWQDAGVSNRIELTVGLALDTLKTFDDQSFDFIFIDADKRSYLNYFEESLRVVKANGVILIDNVLWNGRVIDATHDDPGTQAIRKLNDLISTDPRVEICMVPIGDGLTIVRKK